MDEHNKKRRNPLKINFAELARSKLYTDKEIRRELGIQSQPVYSEDGFSDLTEDAQEFFLYNTGELRTSASDSKRVSWLDRAEDTTPLFEGDRSSMIQMIEALDRFLPSTTFRTRPHFFNLTILHGMLRSLMHNLQLLEIGAAPPLFYPSVTRTAALESHEAFKSELAIVMHYFVSACATKKDAHERISQIAKNWKIKKLSRDTVKRIKPAGELGKATESFFVQLLPHKLKFAHNLSLDDIPTLEWALNIVCDAHKRHRKAVTAGVKKSENQRYNKQNRQEFLKNYSGQE